MTEQKFGIYPVTAKEKGVSCVTLGRALNLSEPHCVRGACQSGLDIAGIGKHFLHRARE